MKEMGKKVYQSPVILKTQIKVESGICAASMTGKKVIDKGTDKVTISEQAHGTWDGNGSDISAEWDNVQP